MHLHMAANKIRNITFLGSQQQIQLNSDFFFFFKKVSRYSMLNFFSVIIYFTYQIFCNQNKMPPKKATGCRYLHLCDSFIPPRNGRVLHGATDPVIPTRTAAFTHASAFGFKTRRWRNTATHFGIMRT